MIKNDNGEWEVLLINQHNKTGGTYWGLPKGHPESDESGEDTARRELFEEAGVSLSSIDTKHPFDQHYTFKWEDMLIDKTVTYYLGFAKDRTIQIDPHEVAEAKWFSPDDAKEKLTHSETKLLLEEAINYLNKTE